MKFSLEEFQRWKASLPISAVLQRLGASKKGTRFFCPLCQPAGAIQHRSPDLAVYEESIHCFKCGFHGDVINLVQQKFNLDFCAALGWLDFRSENFEGSFTPSFENPVFTDSGKRPRGGEGIYIPPEEIAKREALWRYFKDELVEGCLGALYLAKRCIPLSLAKQRGVGFAPWPTWPLRSFVREEGHVVFPHTDAQGRLLNLYARAVELETLSPKALRHCHLPGPKGFFMGRSLGYEDVTLAEGAFDALSLLVIGKQNLVGVFGVQFDLNTLLRRRSVTFAFDRDTAGESWKALSLQLLQAGVIVSSIADELPVGAKDFNEALVSKGQFGSDYRPSTLIRERDKTHFT